MSNHADSGSGKQLRTWIPFTLGAISLVMGLIWMWVLSAPVIHGGTGQFLDVWFPLAPKVMCLGGIGTLVFTTIFALVRKYLLEYSAR